MFIKHEDKQQIIDHLFAGKGKDYHQVDGVKVKCAELNPDTLLYSWGSASNGKLGISNNYAHDFDQDLLPKFYLDDKIEQNSDDFETFVSKKNINLDKLMEADIENLKNLMDFQNRVIFTPKPQPIVALLGKKHSKIQCGLNHVLFLSQDHEIFAWGSNENGQLGLPKKLTEKKTEFTVYQTEEEFNQEKQDQNEKASVPFNEFGSTSSIVGGPPGTTSALSNGARSLIGGTDGAGAADDKKL